eukprot:365313-Chlamydomonas_euryale.AAC.6
MSIVLKRLHRMQCPRFSSISIVSCIKGVEPAASNEPHVVRQRAGCRPRYTSDMFRAQYGHVGGIASQQAELLHTAAPSRARW